MYEYYKTSNKGSDLLVTLYEDRIRFYWHKVCESGRKVDLEVEAGKTHEHIMDECRTRLEATLQACRLRENGQPQAAPQPKDDPAAALLKQQAGMDFDRKRQANEMNAFRQRQAAHQKKVNALKESHDQQPRQQPVKNKFGKGGKHSNKGYGKGQANDQYKKRHKGCNNGKGKDPSVLSDCWVAASLQHEIRFTKPAYSINAIVRAMYCGQAARFLSLMVRNCRAQTMWWLKSKKSVSLSSKMFRF